MAERLAYLEAVVGADITEFRKSMRDIRNDVGILSETISGIGGAARTMTFAFTAPMVALGTYAVQAASGVDSAMRNINSILGLSESEFQALSEEAFSFAKTTRAGVTPALEALYEVFSAGVLDQERAMAVWETSTRVAEAGLADLSATTNAITATMSAFNLETTQASRVGNVWTRMVQLGVGSLNDFLSNSQKVLPLSSALNVSLEDMGATLAFLSQGGGGAAKAETAYAMMLSNMLKPAAAMEEAFSKLGVESGKQLIDRFGSVSAAVMALRDATGDVDFSKLFSKTGLEAALRITDNFDAMTAAVGEFNDGLDTATMDAWAQQSKSFAFQFDLLKTALQSVAVVIGNAIIPFITPLVQGFTDLLLTVSDTNPQLLQLGVLFVGVLAAAAPVVWLLTSMVNPIGLVIAGVAALGAAITTNFNGIRDTILGVVNEVTGGLEPLKETFDTFVSTLFPEEPDTTSASNAGAAVGSAYVLEIGSTISAWDAYEARDEALQGLSWAEFQQWLVDNGWTGGALTEGMSFTFMDEGTAAQLGADAGNTMGSAFNSNLKYQIDAGDTSPVKPPTIFDRLGAAVSAAWPKLQGALDGMWSNFTNWVTTTAIPEIDRLGGDVLNGIAGWFDTSASNFEGDGKLYQGVKGALTADIGAAAGDAAEGFGDKFPQLAAGLNNLFSSMGSWIEAEGLPTLARSIGFVAGRLAGILGDAIGGVWQALTGGGAGDVAGQVGSFVDQSIFTPLSEGVQEGIGASGTTNPFTIFFDNLGALLLLAAGAWVLAPGIVSAIASPIIGAVGSALMTAISASGTVSAISNFVSMLGVGISTAFGALSVLGLGAIIIYGLLNDPGIQAGLAAWAGVWDNFKIIVQYAVSAVELALKGVARSIDETLTNADMQITGARLLIDPNNMDLQVHAQAIGAKLAAFDIAHKLEAAASDYMSGKPVNLDIGGLVWGLSGQADDNGRIAPQAFREALRQNIINPDLVSQMINYAIENDDEAALKILLPVQIGLNTDANPLGGEQDMLSVLSDMVATTGLTPEVIADSLREVYANNPVMLQDIEVAVADFKLLNQNATVDTTAITDPAAINAAIAASDTNTTVELPVNADTVLTNVTAATQNWADTIVKDLPTAVTTAVENSGGDMNIAAASMTAPFATAFTNAFGEGGSVSTVWTTFLTTFVTDVTTLQTTVDENMPKVESQMVTTMSTITTAVNDTKAAIEQMAAMLGSLDGRSIQFTVSSTAGDNTAGTTNTAVDGSHAAGLDYVPRDGYVAELHKGEMVLPAAQAEEFRTRAAVPNVTPSTNIDSSSPTFNFYETMSFSRFLSEAKRRGYNLDKHR